MQITIRSTIEELFYNVYIVHEAAGNTKHILVIWQLKVVVANKKKQQKWSTDLIQFYI